MATIFSEVDNTTEQEVVGLVADYPSLRPADILTQAAHPRMTTAVDTMVVSPHSSRAGADATEEGKREKLRKYNHVLQDLERDGIVYKPAVFSTYGRMHPDVKHMLREAARRLARKDGIADTKGIMKRWKREITAALWNRAACMLHKCMENPRGADVSWDFEEADAFDDDGVNPNQCGRRWIAAK